MCTGASAGSAVGSVDGMRGNRGRKEVARRPLFDKFTVWMAVDVHKRLKIACVEDDMTMNDMLVSFLDARDARAARRAQLAASPLHAVDVVE